VPFTPVILTLKKMLRSKADPTGLALKVFLAA
jgi:hypothetical protein